MFYRFLIVFCLFFSISYADWTTYDLSGNSSGIYDSLLKQDGLGKVLVAWKETSRLTVCYWDGISWEPFVWEEQYCDFEIIYLNFNNEGKAILCWIENINNEEGVKDARLKVAIGNGKTWTTTILSADVQDIFECQVLLNEQNRVLVCWAEKKISNDLNIKASIWKGEAIGWSTSCLAQEKDVSMIGKLRSSLNDNNNAVIAWMNRILTNYKINVAIWTEGANELSLK